MTTRYRLGGFDIESEVALPAAAAPREATAVAEIRYGSVPAALPNCTVRRLLCEATRDEFLLRIPSVASFWVRSGERIVIEVAPEAVPADVTAYLMSYAIGALCHQRGLLVLQAAALAVHDGAVLLLAPSAHGKSTLAAALAARGHAVLCDDVCIIDAAAAPARVHPVNQRLGVWRDALAHFGWQPQPALRVISTLEKYSVDLAAAAPTSLPVSCSVLLRISRPPELGLSHAGLRPAAALAAILEQRLLPLLGTAAGQEPREFQQCARVLEHAASFSLARRWDLQALPQAALLIEQLAQERCRQRA